MKKEHTGLGKIIYTEWIILVVNYYQALRKCEVIYEIVVPILVAGLCSICYYRIGKVYVALNGLSNVLPTAISILIGFTAMLITLLLTSDNKNISVLKTKMLKKNLHNHEISLYQGLHIQFSNILVHEIVLLILVLFYLFCYGIGIPVAVAVVLLTLEVFFVLNILLSVIRGITSLYFSFYRA